MTDLWVRVDDLVGGCADAPADIHVAHGVHLLVAGYLRQAGKFVPQLLEEADRANTLRYLAGRSLLQRLRSLLDGPILLIKGPEVAARYPEPTLRAYGDIDVLVPDSANARSILLEAGFEEIDDYEFSHTQRPLRWPGLPLTIELHHQLPWLPWVKAPSPVQLIRAAIPSATGIEGISAVPEIDHLLFVSAHAWGHAPLRRLGDIIDFLVLSDAVDPELLAGRAEQLGLSRLIATMENTANALLVGRPGRLSPLRTWARHLDPLRERSVAEVHVARWVGALWAPRPLDKAMSLVTTVRSDLQPLPGEPWQNKLARTSRAMRDADAPALMRSREFTNR